MSNHASETTRRRQRDPVKEQKWRQHLKRFATSGQNVRQFCAAHQLAETAFYFWRGEIRRRDGQTPPRRQHARPRPARPLAFARVLVEAAAVGDGLRLRLNGGRELLFPASMAPEQVARLILALEATS